MADQRLYRACRFTPTHPVVAALPLRGGADQVDFVIRHQAGRGVVAEIFVFVAPLRAGVGRARAQPGHAQVQADGVGRPTGVEGGILGRDQLVFAARQMKAHALARAAQRLAVAQLEEFAAFGVHPNQADRFSPAPQAMPVELANGARRTGGTHDSVVKRHTAIGGRGVAQANHGLGLAFFFAGAQAHLGRHTRQLRQQQGGAVQGFEVDHLPFGLRGFDQIHRQLGGDARVRFGLDHRAGKAALSDRDLNQPIGHVLGRDFRAPQPTPAGIVLVEQGDDLLQALHVQRCAHHSLQRLRQIAGTEHTDAAEFKTLDHRHIGLCGGLCR